MRTPSLLAGRSLPARVIQGIAVCAVFSIINLIVVGPNIRSDVRSKGIAKSLLIFVAIQITMGGTAGAIFFAGNGWRGRGGWRRTVANVACGVVPGVLFLFALWVLVRWNL